MNNSKVESIINTEDISEAEVLLIGAPYDGSASFEKGTADGPEKIFSCLNRQVEFLERRTNTTPANDLKIGHYMIDGLEGLNPEHAVTNIAEHYEKLTSKNPFTILIGGEHSVTIGALQSISKKTNTKDITLIQIDAHCDLRNDDSDYNELSPSKYAHSTIARRAHELRYNLVQIGIRTYSEEERDFFTSQNNISVFEWGKGNIPKIEEIISSIKTKDVYLTIDVDGFDPAHMPGTGTPVQGGLEWWYGLNLIEKIFAEKNVIASDVVEVMPQEDTGLTEYGAAQLIYNMIALKFLK